VAIALALVVERESSDHFYTGRFQVTLFPDTAATGFPGPQDVSLDRALDWARDRAMIVTVRIGGLGEFTAGDTPAEGLPALPSDLPLERRRVPEFAHLDRRSDDPPAEWRIDLTITLWGRDSEVEGAAPRILDVIERQCSLTTPPEKTKGLGEIRLRVSISAHARTVDEVEALVERVMSAARAAAGEDRDSSRISVGYELRPHLVGRI
jgi:hypothetical protein